MYTRLVRLAAYKHQFNTSINTSIRKMASQPVQLTAPERAQHIEPLVENNWKIVEGRDAIEKEFTFTDFNEAFSFMTAVALKAEVKCHHPEWFNVYNRVKITWSTHDCSGLSMKDVQMARFCDSMKK